MTSSWMVAIDFQEKKPALQHKKDGHHRLAVTILLFSRLLCVIYPPLLLVPAVFHIASDLLSQFATCQAFD